MQFHIVLGRLPEVVVSKGLETSVAKNKVGYMLNVHTGWKIPEEAIKLRSYGFGMIDLDTFNDPRVTGWVLYLSPLKPIWRIIALMVPNLRK